MLEKAFRGEASAVLGRMLHIAIDIACALAAYGIKLLYADQHVFTHGRRASQPKQENEEVKSAKCAKCEGEG